MKFLTGLIVALAVTSNVGDMSWTAVRESTK